MSDNEANPYGVQVGQVWQDMDPRMHGKKFRVVQLGDSHAIVESFPFHGTRRSIALKRFRHTAKTGYRLLKTLTLTTP